MVVNNNGGGSEAYDLAIAGTEFVDGEEITEVLSCTEFEAVVEGDDDGFKMTVYGGRPNVCLLLYFGDESINSKSITNY